MDLNFGEVIIDSSPLYEVPQNSLTKSGPVAQR